MHYKKAGPTFYFLELLSSHYYLTITLTNANIYKQLRIQLSIDLVRNLPVKIFRSKTTSHSFFVHGM